MKFKYIKPKKKIKQIIEWSCPPGCPKTIKLEEGHRLILKQINDVENTYELYCGANVTVLIHPYEALFNSMHKCPGCDAWIKRIV